MAAGFSSTKKKAKPQRTAILTRKILVREGSRSPSDDGDGDDDDDDDETVI